MMPFTANGLKKISLGIVFVGTGTIVFVYWLVAKALKKEVEVYEEDYGYDSNATLQQGHDKV